MEEYIKTLDEIIFCYKNIEANNGIDCTKEVEAVQKVISDIENIDFRIGKQNYCFKDDKLTNKRKKVYLCQKIM